MKTRIALNKIILVLLLLLCVSSVFGLVPTGSSVYLIKSISGSDVSTADTAIINHYIRQGSHYLSKSHLKLELVDSYIDSALSFCEKKNIEIPAYLHLLEAEYSFQIGDFTISEEESKLAEQNAEKNGDLLILVRTLQFKGKYYLRTGYFKESRDAFMKSIEISRQNKIKGIVPSGYAGVADVLNAAGDIKGYRHTLELMIESSFAENDSLKAETGLLWLGNSYSEGKEFFKADSVLRKCLALSFLTKHTYFTSFSSANIGWGFYCNKLYDSSLYYYNKSLDYSLPGNHVSISDNSLGNMGTIFRDLGKKSKAIVYYEKSLEQAKTINDWYTLSWVYNDMNKLYLDTKDTSKAYLCYVLYKEYNDSVLIKKSSQGLTDARIRYEADNHNKEIALLSLRLKNNRLLNIGFTGLIVLIAVIAILIIRGAKNEERRRLSELNRQISEMTQANLRQQMNPHFIFNTLNSIQYYMFQHDKLATNIYLTKFSSLMRKVLENSQHTSVSLRDELDALTLYLELECLRFKDKFEYVVTVDEEIDPLLYKVPTMLIQPYVENSICHGLKHFEGKGAVKIDIKLGKEILICTIEDNGIGREAAREKGKADGIEHNSLGTRITSSRLDLVNSLYGTSLKTVYTDLTNENGEPAGTRVEIQIPIMT
jgi:tetratricopeptide (TPR) repeat protein